MAPFHQDPSAGRGLLPVAVAAAAGACPRRRPDGRSFRRLASLADTKGIPCVVAIFPCLAVKKNGDYLLTGEHRRVARMARESGLLVWDLAPIFLASGLRSLMTDFVHPNPKGHQLVAKHVFARLSEMKPWRP